MDQGSWTTKASLYALKTTVVGPSTQVGTIGQSVLYNLDVANTGYNTSTYTVTATTIPSSWMTGIGTGGSLQGIATSVGIGPVAPGATVHVGVFVQIPNTAKHGDTATTTVSVTSVGDPSKKTTTSLLTKTLFNIFLPLVRR
jgi:hypothetical protein